MDFRLAEFVRFVADSEPLQDVVDEAKADTWTKNREHAVLLVQAEHGQRFVMVRGGRDGILLDRSDTGDILVRVDDVLLKIVRLAWHVHPTPTGPSDHDRNILDLLGQEKSMLFEINGPKGGTRFTRMSDRRL